MILISVLYQNASTSGILGPSPQGLISSTIKILQNFVAFSENMIFKHSFVSYKYNSMLAQMWIFGVALIEIAHRCLACIKWLAWRKYWGTVSNNSSQVVNKWSSRLNSSKKWNRLIIWKYSEVKVMKMTTYYTRCIRPCWWYCG